MREIPFPQPEQYSDWKDWARAMLVALDQPEAEAPSVVGSKGGNVALSSLLTGLRDLGLVVDKTT